MASSSEQSTSVVCNESFNYESDDTGMFGLDTCTGMSGDNLEKSLTNLNIHIALIAEQREELDRTLKEFCANFAKQQEILGEETMRLRIEMMKLRKNTQPGA